MSQECISYQVFDGQNGLSLEEGTLSAYRNGQKVAEVSVPSSFKLSELILDYQVLALLPELDFCYTEPEQFEIEVTTNPLSLPGEVSGLMTINGESQLWVAYYKKHPDFLRQDEVPPGQRPWAESHPGEGWLFMLPATWQTHPDHLVPRRLALCLESYLDDINAGRNIPLPYRRRFDNVFSASSPAWRVNLPHIISLQERAPSDLV